MAKQDQFGWSAEGGGLTGGGGGDDIGDELLVKNPTPDMSQTTNISNILDISDKKMSTTLSVT